MERCSRAGRTWHIGKGAIPGGRHGGFEGSGSGSRGSLAGNGCSVAGVASGVEPVMCGAGMSRYCSGLRSLPFAMPGPDEPCSGGATYSRGSRGPIRWSSQAIILAR